MKRLSLTVVILGDYLTGSQSGEVEKSYFRIIKLNGKVHWQARSQTILFSCSPTKPPQFMIQNLKEKPKDFYKETHHL